MSRRKGTDRSLMNAMVTVRKIFASLTLISFLGSPVWAQDFEQVNTTSPQTLTNKTLTSPVLSGTVTGAYTLGGTPTITGATLTSPLINTPTITSPTFSGTAIGTYTLAGTPTITAPAISNPTLSGGGILGGTYTGTYTLAGVPTITAPAISSPTFSGGGILGGIYTGTYTFAGTPTITAPAISNPVFSGTATGTYTLAGTPTLTSPLINTGTVGADPTAALGIATKQFVEAQAAALAIINGNLTVTMAANAVTIALKANDGTDPSASNPVRILFRSVTATNAALVSRTITAPLSTVISSGSTGGTLNATLARLYVGAIDNAGTVELYWWNSVSGVNLYAPPESDLITTTAEGGAGAADSAQVLYSTTARSSVPHRILGYFEASEVTAGIWATAAIKLQLMGPGVRRTGDLVQTKRSSVSTVSTGTTAMPFDNSIPQNTEGDIVLTQAITPSSSINILQIHSKAWLAQSNAANSLVLALIQDSTVNALTASGINGAGANQVFMLSLEWNMLASTTSATTFTIRAGNGAGATTTFNGSAGAQLMGGVANSFLEVTEIFA